MLNSRIKTQSQTKLQLQTKWCCTLFKRSLTCPDVFFTKNSVSTNKQYNRSQSYDVQTKKKLNYISFNYLMDRASNYPKTKSILNYIYKAK
jgi:hypothetical protein